MLKKLIFLQVSLSIICLFLTACDTGSHDPAAQQPIPTTADIPEDLDTAIEECEDITSIFESNLAPELQNSCSDCHGGRQAPFFAVRDLDLSFKRTLPLINFDNPENSLIIKQSKNNHCGRANCQGPKPNLEQAVVDLVDEVKLCQKKKRSAQDPQNPTTPPRQIEFSAGRSFFKSQVLPVLQQNCKTCHDRQKYWKDSVRDGLVSYVFKAPQYLKGSKDEVYDRAKSLLNLDRDSFYGAPLFMAAIFLHYDNGTCKTDPGVEQENQSPCIEIRQWWELEKEILNQQSF